MAPGCCRFCFYGATVTALEGGQRPFAEVWPGSLKHPQLLTPELAFVFPESQPNPDFGLIEQIRK